MSKTVLTSYGLSTLAKEIRTRHDEDICGLYCDDDCDICQPPGSAYQFEDEAARRWAAKKLTIPLDPAEDGDDFTPEEWVEVHCQIWKMRTAGSQRDENPRARFQHYSDQLAQSTKFVRNVWRLKGYEEKYGQIDVDDEIDIETEIDDLFDFTDDLDDGDDDVSSFDLSATSEDPGPPVPPEFDPNPGKIH